MGVTIREAMQVGGLLRCKVVAGESALDKEIQYITVMEVPDVIQWLKGNELLLTSLYPIKDDLQAIQNLVPQLKNVGCSALAIKTHRFFESIPESIINEGNRLELPIIEIHNEVSYLDIMTPLMEEILGKSKPDQENLEALLRWVTELAMGGRGIYAIIEAVQQITINKITVESEIPYIEGVVDNGIIAPLNWAQKNELKAAKCSIRMKRLLNDQPTSCIVTPLLLNDELYGYVTCWQTEQKFRELDFVVLDRVIPLLALEFLKVKTKADVEQNFRDDFLSDILLGQFKEKTEVITKAKMFGWDLTQDYQVFAIVFEHVSIGEKQGNEVVWFQEWKKRLLRRVNNIFRYNGYKVIVGIRKDHIVVLFPREDVKALPCIPQRNDPYKEQLMQIAESVRKQLAQEFEDFDFTIGIGRCSKGLDGIPKGYQEAIKSIRLGKSLRGDRHCMHFDDLGIFRILSQFPDKQELEEFYEETIAKLVEYDRTNNTSLVETLSEYFGNNCSLTETSEKLFIHVNTMKYRLQKIEQLTGCNIHNAEDRLFLHLGLKIHLLLPTDER